jgi:prolyl-tRNA synthetase
MAGVYAFLPLGLRVYNKIVQIIREEMNAIDGQEVLMNVLQPKELWEETNRWESAIDIFYKLKDSRDKEMLLAPTHEEQVIDMVRGKAKSYKDLPISFYQMQVKFRNEPRAKSGLLRGREFLMKDMYSFHTDETDLNRYYDQAINAYQKVFSRLGLDAHLVEASGGIFSKYSHEFQVYTEVGEDTVYYCDSCDFAQNKEIAEVKEGDKCPKCTGTIKVANGIEVGNIFKLMTKYSEPMKANFVDKEGHEHAYVMGCYGIGLTRALASIVEVYYDSAKNKMVWPKEVSPYEIELISLGEDEKAQKIYDKLTEQGKEVLFDDRELSAGEKFAEADLIGSPTRIIISKKSLDAGGAEITQKGETKIVEIDKVNL